MSFCSFYHLFHPQHHLSQVLSPEQAGLGQVEAHTKRCLMASTAAHLECICHLYKTMMHSK